ncbi:MAG: hypothetical protein ABSC11_04935 [Smithella sp.]
MSCVSHEQAKLLFIRERDFDKGRTVKEVPLPEPVKVESINDHTSLFIYEFKTTGCRWSYTVDDETKRIISWQFISDPDLCYMKVSYGGAW